MEQKVGAVGRKSGHMKQKKRLIEIKLLALMEENQIITEQKDKNHGKHDFQKVEENKRKLPIHQQTLVPPLKQSLGVHHSNANYKIVESSNIKTFCQQVCYILICMNLDHINQPLVIAISDEVMPYLNMLGL